jgi:hypothetical protein
MCRHSDVLSNRLSTVQTHVLEDHQSQDSGAVEVPKQGTLCSKARDRSCVARPSCLLVWSHVVGEEGWVEDGGAVVRLQWSRPFCR